MRDCREMGQIHDMHRQKQKHNTYMMFKPKAKEKEVKEVNRTSYECIVNKCSEVINDIAQTQQLFAVKAKDITSHLDLMQKSTMNLLLQLKH